MNSAARGLARGTQEDLQQRAAVAPRRLRPEGPDGSEAEGEDVQGRNPGTSELFSSIFSNIFELFSSTLLRWKHFFFQAV